MHPNPNSYEESNFGALNFNKKQIHSLLKSGYDDAKAQVPRFLDDTTS